MLDWLLFEARASFLSWRWMHWGFDSCQLGGWVMAKVTTEVKRPKLTVELEKRHFSMQKPDARPLLPSEVCEPSNIGLSARLGYSG